MKASFHLIRLQLLAGFLLAMVNISSAQLVADFEADTTFGCNVLGVVNFSDLSSGNVTSWRWDLGNGNTSTLQNPTESYTQPGNYTIKLVVSDGVNTDSITKTNFIRVFNSPSANFSVDTLRGCPPLEVNFKDLSVSGDNPIRRRIWDFGDGNSSKAANPTHTYVSSGAKQTSLIAIDSAGCANSFIGPIITVLAGPVALFEAKGVTDTCEAPLTVDFDNISLNQSPSTTYSWDFGDGNTSTLKNPSHTYNNKGSYNVSLIASNGFCSDTIVIDDFVQITNPQALFSTFDDSARTLRADTFCVNDTVFFSNFSQGANQFQWDFGDGTSSTNENPFHQYADSGWYTVELDISSNGACLSDTSFDVYIERVVADFTSTPNFICQRDTFFYTDQSTNAVKWVWHLQQPAAGPGPPPPPIVLNGKNPFHFQTEEGVLNDTLFVTSRAGCKDFTVKIGNRQADFPEISVMPDTVTRGCSPISIQFTHSTVSGIPIDSVLWDFGNGNTSKDSLPPVETYTLDSTYTITFFVYDNMGCVNSQTTQVKVGSPTSPEIFLERGEPLNSVLIDIGDTLCLKDTLTYAELGDKNIKTWKWEVFQGTNDPLISGSQRTTIIVPDTGIFSLKLTVTNNGCDSVIEIDTAFVVSGPTANPFVQIDSCNDLSFTFFSNASEDADEFFWDFGDGFTSDSAMPSHQYTMPGVYTAKYEIRNSLSGCEITGKIKIRAFEIDNSIIVNSDTIGCVPLAINLSTPPNSSSISDWKLPGDSTVRAKTLNYVIKKPGTYKIELVQTNIYGCQETASQVIKVFGVQAKIGIDELNNCIPFEVEFSDDSKYDTTFSSVSWDFGDGQLGTDQIDTIGYTFHDSVFSVEMIVEDVLGCKDTIFLEDTIKTPNKFVDFEIEDSTLCVGDSTEFFNASIGDNQSYKWRFGDGDTAVTKDAEHTFLSEDSFKVVLIMTDLESCTISREKIVSVQADPVPAFVADTLSANCYPLPVNFTDTTASPFVTEWNWDFGNGSVASIQNPFHNFSRPGEFDITLEAITSNGCSGTTTKVEYIKTSGPFAEIAKSEDTLCKYEDITFNMINPSNVGRVLWNFGNGDTASGPSVTYQYTAKTGTIFPTMILSDSASSCFVTFRDTVFVEDVIADFTSDVTMGCVPLRVNFDNTSNRADILAWDFGDGNQSSDSDPIHTFDSVGTFTVALNIVNLQNGCVDTAFQDIDVTEIPDVTVSADTSICEGDTILLTASGGDIYQWSLDPSLQNPNSSQTPIFPTINTSYTVTVSSNEGCVDTASVNVNVQPKPTEYTLMDADLIIGETVRLRVFFADDTVKIPDPSFSYQWSPTRWLSCTDCYDPIAQPLETTTYEVAVTDPLGCFDTLLSALIDVNVAFSVELPQAFTPNGDGLNDSIRVRGWGLKELLQFQIFNRWGEMVYESTSLKKSWDGKFKGEFQANETYVYLVRVLTYNDEVIFKKGNFKLIR